MRYITILLILKLSFVQVAAQNSVLGKWKTIDDETGKERSIIEVYEKNGMLFGKVARIYTSPGENQDPICSKCEQTDIRFNKKILGMDIMLNLKPAEDGFSGGTILDPNNGKVYSCKIWLNGSSLMVRGYWGPFYRTQTWIKVD